MTNLLRVFTAFSGYDSQCMALDEVSAEMGFEYELVGWSEIDKYAIQAHNAIYPQWADRNFGDITKIDPHALPDFDLFTYSSPCQDFSNAGRRAGGEKDSGTRSSLLWYCEEIIRAKRPRFLLWENVRAAVGKKNLHTFKKWESALRGMGYVNYTDILDSQNYGTPQHRERVFCVSIHGKGFYMPPAKQPLGVLMEDKLEDDVDEKYYLSERLIEGNISHSERKKREGCGFKFEPSNGKCVAKTISTQAGARQTDNFIIEPRIHQVGVLKETKWNRQQYRVYSPKGLCPTLNTVGGGGLEPKIIQRPRGFNKGAELKICPTITSNSWQENNLLKLVRNGEIRIRKLTPRECFRLMNVSEENIDKIQSAGISNTQQYKLAGNSIDVNVLKAIFRQLFRFNEI